nr:hypothetical protein [uncultured Ruminococcus sp.]
MREREESGLSIREFCAGKAISPNIPEPFNPGGIVIRTNAATIEITGNANPETVRAAVSFLRQP